ncbi:hypothetical protein NA57DRAFT_59504 [Rhizodiscina lignyota]|uniref:Uncharacterized protein n=1 Tax=Rhizodiscina lignyota TaxID=1504668 RepID=A0A9P4IA45_9PEZI|nr:hypothetical protein NA57DRAFT_59504 [Rhizodiscina lignyota]
MSLHHPFSPHQTPLPQSNNPVMSEVYRIAERLVQRFPDKAIELLAHHCDVNTLAQYLQEACDRRPLDFHTVLSSGGSDSSSQSSYSRTPRDALQHRQSVVPDRRYSPTPSSQASSPILTSPSSQQHPLTKGVEFVDALDSDPEPKRLSMRSDAQSYSLISEDTVRERLHLKVEDIGSPRSVPYNDAQLEIFQTVSLTWKKLNSWRTHGATCFLVQSDLLDVDVIVGKLRAEDLIRQTGNPFAAQSPQQGSRGVFHPQPQKASNQGPRGEDLSIAYSSIEDFPDATPPHVMVRQVSQRSSTNRTSNVLRERQHPIVTDRTRTSNMPQSSKSSKIPRRQNSPARSSGSASSRVSGRHPHGHSSMAPSHTQRTSQPESARVRIVWEGIQVTARFRLSASGEAFLEDLNQAIGPMTRVDRHVHYVRFSTEKGESVTNSCEVNLLEDDVALDWEDAVEWIKSKMEIAPRLYAMIEQRDAG